MTRLVSLGDIACVQSGGTPSRKNKAFYGGSIPWAKISDLETTDGLVTKTDEYITDEGLAAIGNRLFSEGTLLFAMYGSVGKTAIAGCAMTSNQAILGIFPKDRTKLDTNYLRYFLASKQRIFEKEAQGVAQKNLSATYIRELKLPLPTFSEQQRIASILGKADTIRRKRKRAINLADELLRSVFVDMFGDPHSNSKNWPISTLAEVIDPETSITYGIVQAGPHIEDGVKYIRTGDFKNGRLADDGYAKTAPEIAAKFERSRVKQGELVYCIRASIGAVDIVPEHMDGANLTQGTARISPGPRVLADFLVEQMRTKGFRTYIDRESKGATFKEITLTRLREAPVIVPPIPMQERFREIRSALLDMQKKMVISKDLPLFESLSKRAFSGEL